LAIIVTYTAAMLPQDLGPDLVSLGDKTQHILAFVVLAVLLRFGYAISYIYAFLLLLGFGAFIEFSQYYTPQRVAEFRDLIADSIGIVMGLTLYRYIHKVL